MAVILIYRSTMRSSDVTICRPGAEGFDVGCVIMPINGFTFRYFAPCGNSHRSIALFAAASVQHATRNNEMAKITIYLGKNDPNLR